MKKRFLIIPAVAVCAIALSSVLFLTKKSKKTVTEKKFAVAFYSIDSYTKKGMTKALNEFKEKNRLNLTITELTDEDLLNSSKTDKLNLIFTEAGSSLNKTIEASSRTKQKNPANVKLSVLSEMPTSIQQSTVYEKKQPAAIPVLVDFLQLNIDASALNSSKYKDLLTWSDFLDFSTLPSLKTKSPIIFGGKDPVFLLDLLGAFAEAFDGSANYHDAVKIINQAAAEENPDISLLADKLVNYSDSPLYNTVYNLRLLYNRGLISKTSFQLLPENLEQVCRNREQKLFFMNLSTLRSFSTIFTNIYNSIFIPSNRKPATRTFTANIKYAVPVIKNPQTNYLLEEITSSDFQVNLSRATGLAPVHRSCLAPDVQANDVRYWLAATTTPLPGLGHECELSEAQMIDLCNRLRTLIVYGK